VLGAVPGLRGVYLNTGHGPTGLQLGPYSGKLVAGMLLGKPSETDIGAFDVRRSYKTRAADYGPSVHDASDAS
jgi:D-amino-acid dehydrogenase